MDAIAHDVVVRHFDDEGECLQSGFIDGIGEVGDDTVGSAVGSVEPRHSLVEETEDAVFGRVGGKEFGLQVGGVGLR